MGGKAKSAIAALFLALTIADAVVIQQQSPQNKAGAASETVAQSTVAAIGKPAPDFTLTDTTGKAHSLSQYKGKLVVLEWVNFDCPFVKKHYGSGNMQKLQEKYTKKGVEWLSINSSAAGRQGNYPPAKLNELLKSHSSHASAYLIDESGKVGHMYGATATPHMFVINQAGTLVYAGAIDDRNSADEADISSAKNYVAAALEQVLAGKPVTTAQTQAYGCSVKYQK
jgi:peroxiredoxin